MTKAEKKTAEILLISHFFAPLGGPIFLIFLYYFAVKKPGTRLLFLSAVSNVLFALIALICTILITFSLYSILARSN